MHNGEACVGRAVDSILGQTFEDFELLVCDDGSSDGTAEILRQHANRDPRVRIISKPERQGISPALNTLLRNARGEFVARMDADDICLPGRLAVQRDAYPAGSHDTVAFGACEVMNAEGRKLVEYTPPLSGHARHLRFRNPFIHPLLFTRTALLRGFAYRDIPFTEDYDLYARMQEQGVRFQVIPEVLLRYTYPANRDRQARKLFEQMLAAGWIRERVRTGTASTPLSDLDRFGRQFDYESFSRKLPLYLGCSGEFFDMPWTGWCRLLNYFRFDPLLRLEVRNALAYRASMILDHLKGGDPADRVQLKK